MDRAGRLPLLTVAAALALAMVAFACKPDRPSGQRTEHRIEKKVSAVEETVVARIGERTITFGELEERLEALPVHSRMRYRSTERKLEFLESYLQFQVLALVAESQGYARHPDVLDALKNDMVERYLRTEVDLKVKTTDVPESDIVAYYESRTWEFVRPAQGRFQHLRVQDEALAKKLAFRIRHILESTNRDPVEEFAEFVSVHSDDESTRESGGDIGLLPRVGPDSPAVPEAVERAAVGMNTPLTISPVVQADDGFHVLFLTEMRPAIDLSLDQARPRIVAHLMDEIRMQRRRELAGRLRDEADVRVDKAALDDLLEGRKARMMGDAP